jgi:hypothetical protein
MKQSKIRSNFVLFLRPQPSLNNLAFCIIPASRFGNSVIRVIELHPEIIVRIAKQFIACPELAQYFEEHNFGLNMAN